MGTPGGSFRPEYRAGTESSATTPIRALARRWACWLRDHSGAPPGYHDYLRLDALLGQTRPLTPSAEPATRLDERFFIVVHQATELWLTQVRADLARAAMCATRQGGWTEACERVERAAATVALLVGHLDHLDHLSQDAFLAFRDRLGTASGADSDQCRDLLLGENHPSVAALRDVRTQPPDPATARRLQAALDAFVETVQTWRSRHAQQASSFIGGRPGTGGTSGVRYLTAGVPALQGDR